MTDADICRRFSIAAWTKPGAVGVNINDAHRLVRAGLLKRRRMISYEFSLTHRGYILAEANIVSEIFE